jgi:dTDP-4-amino-4,6-dideoxygalactose transaminase
LGTIGHLGCYSFHETKNYNCGESGALLANQEQFVERAEIIREKGTDRLRFFRGQVNKYTWVDVGSSYLPSEIIAGFLYAQLEQAEEIKKDRLNSWDRYYERLFELGNKGLLDLPYIPDECNHNAHMFYVKCSSLEERTRLINFLKENVVQVVFRYVPLHSSDADQRFGRFHGEDIFTTTESERLVRLPLYFNMVSEDIDKVIDCVKKFYI